MKRKEIAFNFLCENTIKSHREKNFLLDIYAGRTNRHLRIEQSNMEKRVKRKECTEVIEQLLGNFCMRKLVKSKDIIDFEEKKCNCDS